MAARAREYATPLPARDRLACHVCDDAHTALVHHCPACQRPACEECMTSGVCLMCVLPAHAHVHRAARRVSASPRRVRFQTTSAWRETPATVRKRTLRTREDRAPRARPPGFVTDTSPRRRSPPAFTLSRTVSRERMRLRTRALSNARSCDACGFACARCTTCTAQMCVTCSESRTRVCAECETALQAENDVFTARAAMRHATGRSPEAVDRALARWSSAPSVHGNRASPDSDSL